MSDTKIDVLTLDSFLDTTECRRIVDEIRASKSEEAGLYGGATAVDPSVRSVLAAAVSAVSISLLTDRLLAIVPKLEKHFGVELAEIEEPQFLFYRAGDHFVAHQDGNTPLIQDWTLRRKVSIVVFLNPQEHAATDGNYSGGSLVFHGAYPDWEYRQDATSSSGTLVAFRSETTHEVRPVTGGERFTIVSWLRE